MDKTPCEGIGFIVNGAYAEYVIADAAAPLLCAGVTAYKGIKETAAKPGEWVAIVRIGGLGHLAIQYAKTMGFQVITVDIDDEKLALAREIGAALTVNSK